MKRKNRYRRMLSSWATLGTGASAGLTGKSTSGWPGWAYTGFGSMKTSKHVNTNIHTNPHEVASLLKEAKPPHGRMLQAGRVSKLMKIILHTSLLLCVHRHACTHIHTHARAYFSLISIRNFSKQIHMVKAFIIRKPSFYWNKHVGLRWVGVLIWTLTWQRGELFFLSGPSLFQCFMRLLHHFSRQGEWLWDAILIPTPVTANTRTRLWIKTQSDA